ncbi:MAG TPA: P1 family peptidase [Ilumatobacter sp.]|nr:P1 family peptidase [Ilumatobacter sp.]
MSPGATNTIVDVAGVCVGHHSRSEAGWLTGTTVVLPPPGTVGGVDVRGGGPGVGDLAPLDPTGLVPTVDAICLSGGSAYGLAAADGVRAWLERRRRGFSVGPERHHVVPIVPAAILFDLGRGGRFGNRPTAAFGRAAAAAASTETATQGNVGAGTGAFAGMLRGGIGSASVVLPSGITVAALVALNSAGSVVDPASGRLWGADRGLPGEFAVRRPKAAEARAFRELPRDPHPLNTTLAVVATDAELTKAECTRLAIAAHDGMARAIDPIHLYTDGDVAFALATGALPVAAPADGGNSRPQLGRPALLAPLLAAAADTVTRAIVHAALAATPAAGRLSYREQFPSAFA